MGLLAAEHLLGLATVHLPAGPPPRTRPEAMQPREGPLEPGRPACRPGASPSCGRCSWLASQVRGAQPAKEGKRMMGFPWTPLLSWEGERALCHFCHQLKYSSLRSKRNAGRKWHRSGARWLRLVPEKQNRLSWRPWAERRRACPPSALRLLLLAPHPGWSPAVPDSAQLAGHGARC